MPRAILTLLLLVVSLPPAAVRAQEAAEAARARPGDRVVSIRFEGNVRYSEEYLEEQITTKEGQPFDPALLSRDERILRDLFTAVTDVEDRAVEGGVEIVFHVLDRSVVGKVELLGLSRVREDDIRALLRTRPGYPLLDHALASDRELIARMHREMGYPFVDVQSYTRASNRPDVQDVVFQVLPNRRVFIRKVILEGAHSLDRYLILQGVKNSDAYRTKYLGLGRIFSFATFERSALANDRRLIEFHYRREGFLDARVVVAGVRFDDDRTGATVHFRIEEGPRYSIGSFAVAYAEGGLPEAQDAEYLEAQSLERLGALEPGQAYREEDLANARRRISERLWTRGYAKSTVVERITPVAETRSVALLLTVRAGPKIRVGRVRILGNRWTRDNVIRRQFRDGARPGDYLNIEALEAAETRLNALRYFDSVRFGSGSDWGLVKSADPTRPDEYDVELEVDEAPQTRSMSLGAAISSDGGANLQFSVTWRNFDIGKLPESPWPWDYFASDAFRGNGQTFTLLLSPGTTFSNYQIAFSDPAVADSRWSLSTNLARRLAYYDDYRQTTDGVWIRVGRYLDPRYRWNLSFQWSLRQVLIDEPEPDAPVNALDAQGTSTLHGIGATLRHSARREADPFLNGYVGSLSAETYGGVFGGHVDIVKLGTEHGLGWRILQREMGEWHRVSVVVSADWATAFGATPEVPIFERHFLGGQNLRGFEYREVGPRSNSRPTGGEFMLRVVTEYTIPLVSARQGVGIDLVFFLDQGGLTTTLGEFGSDDWRISVGAGLALALGGVNQPPFRLDFGWPLRMRDGDRKQLFSFNIERSW